MAEGSAPRWIEPQAIHVREYLRILRKRVWLIVACFLVVVVTVAVATYLERPIYRAATRVVLERQAPRVVNFQDSTSPVEWWDRTEFFQTQVQIIRSRPVLQRVIDSLGLANRKLELAQAADAVAAVRSAITVDLVKNTRLIEIQVEDPEPTLAAEMANALANAYLTQTLELKLNAARDALAWLTTHVTDLKAKVNESELALQRYREGAGLIAVEEKQSLSTKKLGEFNSGYVEAKAKRLEMETRLAELRKASQQLDGMESSPMVIANPLVQRLKGQLVELEVQRSKLLKVYKDKHPEVLKVQSQIEEIAQKIREEVGRVAQSLESEYNVMKAREAAMLGAVNQYRDEVQGLAKKEIQYGILKRDADTNQQLYELLLKRLKETNLSQELDTNNVRIVEPAVVPTYPVKPRKVRNLAFAVVAGLTLGVGLALFVEYMDDTVGTPEQVEQTLGVPVFALIPVIPSRK